MNPRQSCYARKRLKAFYDGRIDVEADIDAISRHLDACQECLSLLDDVANTSPSQTTETFTGEAQYRHALAFSQTIPQRLEQELPEKIANFEVLARLGTGAVGEVFYVWDHSVNLPRVVKRLRVSRSLDAQFHQKIQEEARIVGRVKDPRVAKPIFAGDDDGFPFIVMEYAEGKSLYARVAESGPLTVAEAAGVGMELALALKSVHNAGLIHRDVKPENVICSSDGKKITLVDLGLAVEKTAARSVAGTPSFMAPEQANESVETDARADYYGLAATVFFSLTGEPPIRIPGNADRELQLDSVKRKPRLRVSECRSGVPESFASVIDDYLNVNADDRPANLEPWLKQCSRYAGGRRSLGLFVYGAIGLVLLVAIALVASAKLRFSNSAQVEKTDSRWLADQNWQPGPRRNRALGLVYARADLGVDWELDTKQPRSAIRCFRKSPDGKLLACLAGEGALRIFELGDGSAELKHLFPNDRHSDYYWLTLAWSHDSTRLAVGSDDKRSIAIWDVASARLERTIPLDVPLNGVVWSPDDSQFASCDDSGRIRLWSSSGEPVATIAELSSAVHRLAWHPGGENRIASISADGFVRVWDSQTGEELYHHRLGGSLLQSMSWNPVDFRIAVVSNDGLLTVLDETCRLLERVGTNATSQHDVRWSPDGKQLAIAGDAGCILWNGEEPKLVFDARIKPQCIDWENDSQHLLIPDPSNGLIEFDLESGASRVVIKTTSSAANAVCWSPTGTTLAVATAGGTIRLFDRSGISQGSLRLSRTTTFSRLCWSTDGSFLAAPVPYGNEITIWDVKTKVLIRSLASSDISNAACWLGDYLLTGGEDSKVTVWSTKTWTTLAEFQGSKTVEDIVAHPTERIFAFADRGGTLRFVSLGPDGECREAGARVQFDDPLRSIEWHPAGQTIAVADERRRVFLVDYTSRKVIREHKAWNRPGFVSWEPSGKRLAAGLIGVLDGQSLKSVWQSYELSGYSFGWSPDGNFITSGTSRGVVRSFDPATKSLVWQAVLTSDRDAVTLSPAGEVISATGDSLGDMVVSVRSPDGEYKTLSYRDFYEQQRRRQ